ncbi:hypothetical protein I5168_09450 [Nonlabens sp. SCSIO 43208]|uniref:hypothetical protein n=1 Tax=Nonlabens sp. SCSIO 43208 TaxID=2793009 RepID=UPI003D6AC312
MKNILLKFLIGILIASCIDRYDKIENSQSNYLYITDSNKNDELRYIDKWNSIELAHTNNEYGEWGGDTEIINIYSDGKVYYANYAKYLGEPGPPDPPKEDEEVKVWYEYKKLNRKIDSVELTANQLRLIKDAIYHLTQEKITTSSFAAHGGIVNSVVSKDSTLIIDSYPSDEWKPFQKLKKTIIE